MYVTYVTVRSYINPKVGPALPKEERINFREKLKLLQGIIAPILLIVLVLGVIFTGVATPVEAAGIGTFGALLVCALSRKLTLLNIAKAAVTTLKATTMVLWIMFGASVFVGFYILNGGQEFVIETMMGTGLSPYGILLITNVLLIILGMFLDWVGILLLAVPIFVPMMVSMSWPGFWGFSGVDPANVRLWFGVVYMVNMQMSFLSPPFGYALYYLKSVAPPEVQMSTIFKSSAPFMVLQAIGLFIAIAFPWLCIWLPRTVYGF
jgi:tripartite ATP-independent transporter DctM subunit